jgi:hypothetical protein
MSKKKNKNDPKVSASVDVDEFTEKFEKEFSLMTCLSGSGYLVCEEIEALFVESGAYWHIMGMRYVFLIFSKIDSD